jgi:hypothetical protein
MSNFLSIPNNSSKIYASFVLPASSSNFGTHYSHFGVGGFVELPSLNERNSIPVAEEMNTDGVSSGRRKFGMLVYVLEDRNFDQLTPRHTSTSGGVEGNYVTFNEWATASDAQKMVWLDPIQQREDVSFSTYTLITGSGNPDDAWTNWTDINISDLNEVYLPLSGGTITGDLIVNGTFTSLGTATFLSSVNLAVSDPLIHLALNNSGNLFDIGFVGHYKNPASNHSGLVRDHQENEWFLFSGISSIPLSATDIDFTDTNIIIDTLNANLKGNLLQDTKVFGELSGVRLFTNIGNSDQWQTTYNTVCGLSAVWNETHTVVSTNSANWNSAYSLVSTSIVSGGNSFGNHLPIGTNDSYNFILETNNIPRLTILSGGNIGIGTSIPNHALTVNGDISANVLRLTSSTSNSNGIQFGTDVNLYRLTGSILATDDNFRPALGSNNTSNEVVVARTTTTTNTLEKRNINTSVWNTTATFLTASSTTSLTPNYLPKTITSNSLGNSIVYETNNNVGIDTIAPNEKLTVSGNISASGYVFQKTKLNFITEDPYTFKISDENCMLLFNPTTPVTAYVPSDTNEGFGIGASVLFSTLSSLVYVVGEPGVTIRASDGRNYLRTTNSAATLLKIASNDWLLFGDIWSENLN